MRLHDFDKPQRCMPFLILRMWILSLFFSFSITLSIDSLMHDDSHGISYLLSRCQLWLYTPALQCIFGPATPSHWRFFQGKEEAMGNNYYCILRTKIILNRAFIHSINKIIACLLKIQIAISSYIFLNIIFKHIWLS